MKRIGILAALLCLAVAGCQPKVEPAAEANPKETVATTAPVTEKAAPVSKGKQAEAQKVAQKGTVAMNDESKPPRERYKIALEIYREALALDPNNKEAKENKALIESIYKSMGKPVPGE